MSVDSLLIKTLVVKVLSVDSLLIKTLALMVPSDLTEEEDLEEVSDSEEDSEVDSEDSEETHTDGLRLVTTPNTPLLTHLMTLTSTL